MEMGDMDIHLWIRQRGLTHTDLSLHEVNIFVSDNSKVASAWVNTIYERINM